MSYVFLFLVIWQRSVAIDTLFCFLFFVLQEMVLISKYWKGIEAEGLGCGCGDVHEIDQ
jgi:hypothetical protein